jgi:hypothetical protein
LEVQACLKILTRLQKAAAQEVQVVMSVAVGQQQVDRETLKINRHIRPTWRLNDTGAIIKKFSQNK